MTGQQLELGLKITATELRLQWGVKTTATGLKTIGINGINDDGDKWD
jgi:hypothetical protein